MTSAEIIQIITGCIGSCGFGILFNIRGYRLLWATVGGLVSWTLFVILGYVLPDETIRYFLVSMVMSLYAEILARLLRTPTTTFLMTTLVPLIPGGSLYYTMSHALSEDWSKFGPRALYTAKLALALALGIVVTTILWHYLFQHKRKEHHEH